LVHQLILIQASLVIDTGVTLVHHFWCSDLILIQARPDTDTGMTLVQ